MNNLNLQKALGWLKRLLTSLSIESFRILYGRPSQTIHLAFYYDLSNDQVWHCIDSNLALFYLVCLLLGLVSPNLFQDIEEQIQLWRSGAQVVRMKKK